ncbi:MAG: type II toxin-antitoxin system HicB family antitoxin [Simkaniaceae bacterium]|nr:type II toxin-antitoxin system HicB family antitoxin [Candidatus Sacchlamyda saccharinae]
MEFEGKIWKDGKFWLVEVPSLNLMTQGKTRKEGLEMIRDAAIGLVECYFESEIEDDFDIILIDYGSDTFGITSNEDKLLLALSLRRQREESGSTVREAASRLGSKSPNGYAQYEKGRTRISLDQYEKLMRAVNPNRISILRVI